MWIKWYRQTQKKTIWREKKIGSEYLLTSWADCWKWSSILTFYDIPLSTIVRYTNLLSLVTVFGRRYIFLRPHPMRHEHDTVAQALCPNLMWLCTAVNSVNWNTKRTQPLWHCKCEERKIESNYHSKMEIEMKIEKLTSLPMIAMHTAIILIDFGCGQNKK